MPLIPDTAVIQERLAAFPLTTYQAGENVFVAGSRTDRLLFLRQGAVAIVKEAIEIAKVTEPGAVFGELSALLDQPHTADVRALETSQFHVANADSLHDALRTKSEQCLFPVPFQVAIDVGRRSRGDG